MRASLLADAGARASSAEFFRSPQFLAAEGVTHTLLVEGDGGGVALPLVVREIPGSDLLDAASPYGYPGGELGAEVPDPAEVDWTAAGLVSAFIRDRVGARSLAGGSERSTLQIADPELPPKSRPSDRQQIRRNEARGYRVRHVAGPQSSADDRRGFADVYEQTMRRASAGDRYFFGAEYFDAVLASERSWLFLVDAPEGGIATASIAALSDGFLHYYLTGTADEHLSNAPNKNLIVTLAEFSAELGAPLNLGGGITPGDGLEEFKRGFANRQLPYVTHELVLESGAYAELSAGRPDSDFFPRYRAT